MMVATTLYLDDWEARSIDGGNHAVPRWQGRQIDDSATTLCLDEWEGKFNDGSNHAVPRWLGREIQWRWRPRCAQMTGKGNPMTVATTLCPDDCEGKSDDGGNHTVSRWLGREEEGPLLMPRAADKKKAKAGKSNCNSVSSLIPTNAIGKQSFRVHFLLHHAQALGCDWMKKAGKSNCNTISSLTPTNEIGKQSFRVHFLWLHTKVLECSYKGS